MSKQSVYEFQFFLVSLGAIFIPSLLLALMVEQRLIANLFIGGIILIVCISTIIDAAQIYQSRKRV